MSPEQTATGVVGSRTHRARTDTCTCSFTHCTAPGCRRALPRLDRRRLEPGRRGDLEHLQIVGVLDLGVDDARRLMDAVAGLQPDLADALVLEHHPAVQ